MKHTIIRPTLFRLAGWVLIIPLALFAGCAFWYETGNVQEDILSYETDRRDLEKGYEAFQKGDLRHAKEIFDALSQDSENEEIARQALYALTSTSLLLAKSADDFDEAMILWNTWSALGPSHLVNEDPRMLGTILHQKFPYNMARDQEPETALAVENMVSWRLLRAKEKEIKRLKLKINNRDKEIQKLKLDSAKLEAMEKEILTLKHHKIFLEAMEKEIQRLRHQIKSMEAIDQKIQEKKKEASSP